MFESNFFQNIEKKNFFGIFSVWKEMFEILSIQKNEVWKKMYAEFVRSIKNIRENVRWRWKFPGTLFFRKNCFWNSGKYWSNFGAFRKTSDMVRVVCYVSNVTTVDEVVGFLGLDRIEWQANFSKRSFGATHVSTRRFSNADFLTVS